MASNNSNNKAAPPRLVIITGLSGSGMSSAMKAFEDLHYFCVDNLPLTMLQTFARLLLPNEDEVVAIERAALVINIRERHFLSQFPDELKKLKKKKLEPYVLFFEASDEALKRRFSETRRPHPAESGRGLTAAVSSERRAMKQIREQADLIIDTSEHTVHTLRRFIVEKFGQPVKGTPFRVQVVSFGHKFGNPRDLDLMFDVRHLPNPFFEPKLKDLTGDHKKIVKYLRKHPEVEETVERFSNLLEYLLPFYKREGKAYLTVGIGCTGGKHRSVTMAQEISRRLADVGYDVATIHRDLGRE